MMEWLKTFLKRNKGKKILIMPVGISGSGKTTFYKNIKDEFEIEYLSFDKIRIDFYLEKFPELKNKPVREIYKKAYFYASKNKLKPLKLLKQKIINTDKNIIYVDNTNLKKKTRNKILCISQNFIKIGIYFDISLEDAIERQKLENRDKYISPKLIKEQYSMIEAPTIGEFDILYKLKVKTLAPTYFSDRFPGQYHGRGGA